MLSFDNKRVNFVMNLFGIDPIIFKGHKNFNSEIKVFVSNDLIRILFSFDKDITSYLLSVLINMVHFVLDHVSVTMFYVVPPKIKSSFNLVLALSLQNRNRNQLPFMLTFKVSQVSIQTLTWFDKILFNQNFRKHSNYTMST